MLAWRKLTSVVAVTAVVAAGFPSSSAFAQARVIRASETPTAPVDWAVPADQAALIASAVHAHPNGGEPLKLAISGLIVKHPDLAPSVAAFLRNNPSLTRAQKQAIFAGLGDALGRMGIVAADLLVKAPPAGAVAPVEEGISPWLIALLLAAAGAGIGCAIACGNNNTTTAAVVPVPSPN